MITEEEKLLKLRIQHLLDVKNISIRTISDSESERVMLGRQVNGQEAVVSYRTISKLLFMFPDIDANWLVMGEGSMYKTEHIAPRVYTQNNNVHDNKAGGDITVGGIRTAPSLQEVDKMRARIEELERDKSVLQNVVASLTACIRK